MSRHAISLGEDDNCVIGFDPMLETFFFQGGLDEAGDEPLIWLGGDYREHLDLRRLEREIRERSGLGEFRLGAVEATLRSEALGYFKALAQAGEMAANDLQEVRKALGAGHEMSR